MEKIYMLAMSIVLALGINFITEIPMEGAGNNYSKAYWFVQTEDDQWMYGKTINEITDGEMVFEKKYKLGDIVEVTTNEYGEIVSEKLVTGSKLEKLEDKYAEEINALMEEGVEMMVMNDM